MDYKKWRIANGLTQEQAGEKIGVSKSTWGRIERGLETKEAFLLLARALVGESEQNHSDQPAQESLQAEDPDAITINSLPVAQNTEYLTLRNYKSRRVMTFLDIADAYQVPVSSVHRAFYSNRSRWNPTTSQNDVECSMEAVQTPTGLRTIMLFTLKGASRFAFHLRSGRAEQVQDHCLELLMAEARGEITHTPAIDTGMASFAQLIGLRVNQAEADAKAYTDHRIEQVQQAVAAMPTQAADEVLARLQAVDTLKSHLHSLVDAIVKRAQELPQSDPFGWQYSHYSRAWRAVHEWAKPQVKSKSEYRTPNQVLSAIRGAEMILTKLGGEIPAQPEQLQIDLGVAV